MPAPPGERKRAKPFHVPVGLLAQAGEEQLVQHLEHVVVRRELAQLVVDCQSTRGSRQP
jgi:hypothetical protein